MSLEGVEWMNGLCYKGCAHFQKSSVHGQSAPALGKMQPESPFPCLAGPVSWHGEERGRALPPIYLIFYSYTREKSLVFSNCQDFLKVSGGAKRQNNLRHLYTCSRVRGGVL